MGMQLDIYIWNQQHLMITWSQEQEKKKKKDPKFMTSATE